MKRGRGEETAAHYLYVVGGSKCSHRMSSLRRQLRQLSAQRLRALHTAIRVRPCSGGDDSEKGTQVSLMARSGYSPHSEGRLCEVLLRGSRGPNAIDDPADKQELSPLHQQHGLKRACTQRHRCRRLQKAFQMLAICPNPNPRHLQVSPRLERDISISSREACDRTDLAFRVSRARLTNCCVAVTVRESLHVTATHSTTKQKAVSGCVYNIVSRSRE